MDRHRRNLPGRSPDEHLTQLLSTSNEEIFVQVVLPALV
jgi:hypothetical protein